jgi:hypothetical protein
MRFCGGCGASQRHALDEPGKTVIKRKFIIPLLLSVIVLLAGLTALWFVFFPSFQKTKGSVTFIAMDGETVVIPYGKRPVTVNGVLVDYQMNADGVKAAFLVNEHGTGANKDGYVLYWVTDIPYRVAEGVYDILISFSGDGIVFTRNRDENTDTADLCLYAGSKLTTVTVTTEFKPSGGMAVSPDGKTVFYTGPSGLSYIYTDGENINMGYDNIPVAVSNNRKQIYFIRDNTFYVTRKKGGDDERTRLGEFANQNPDMWTVHFNKNLSQILYVLDGRTYISRQAKEREPLPGTAARLLLPDRAYTVNNFYNTYYLSNNGEITYINRLGQTQVFAEGVQHARMADGGKHLIYMKNGCLYKQNKENEPVLLTDSIVTAFTCTAKGDAVYYTDRENALYYLKTGNEPVFITDDWRNESGGYELQGLFKGNKILYMSGHDLYIASGGKSARVRGLIGDVQHFGADAHRIWAQTAERTETGIVDHFYYSTNGTRFTHVGVE